MNVVHSISLLNKYSCANFLYLVDLKVQFCAFSEWDIIYFIETALSNFNEREVSVGHRVFLCRKSSLKEFTDDCAPEQCNINLIGSESQNSYPEFSESEVEPFRYSVSEYVNSELYTFSNFIRES